MPETPVKSTETPLLQEIVRRLVDFYRPRRIYLFGSTSRGDSGPDSDFDFMVLVPDDTPKAVRRDPEVFRLLGDIDAPIDILVWTLRDFDSRLHLPASFPSTVVREGKLLYAA